MAFSIKLAFVGVFLAIIGAFYAIAVKSAITSQKMTDGEFEDYGNAGEDSFFLNDPIVWIKQYRYLAKYLHDSPFRSLKIHLKCSHAMLVIGMVLMMVSAICLVAMGA